MKRQFRPPSWVDRLLQWRLPEEQFEEVQGDMHELYAHWLKQMGNRKANRVYLLNALTFFRPLPRGQASLKKVKQSSLPILAYMLQHTLLLIYRNFKRFKSSFLINLLGLSTGLACSLLIYLWVNHELSIDKFHQKDSQLFQALLLRTNTDRIETERATPALLAETLADEMPEVEHAVATTSGMDIPLFTLSLENKHIKAAGQFAAKDFFTMFSYDLLAGDKSSVLADKNSIVISQALALKLFNTTENIIGKTLEWQIQGNPKQAFISGIFYNIPSNSSDQFDFVISFDHFKELMGEGYRNWGATAPTTYVLLKKGTNVNSFNTKIAGFLKSKDNTLNTEVFLRPYSDKYLYDKYENGVQAGGRISYVRLFSIIAIFILVIACINFMNLSTAKASRRVKEVGIKKAVGAGREVLIFQFLGESILMAFTSLILAIVLVMLLLPQFNQITGKELSLSIDTNLIVSALSLTLLTGIVSGSYPALYLSGFRPAAVLKGKLQTSIAEIWARKGLVVFQFTLSVILIVSVLVVYNQIEYIQSKHLGYSKDNVLYFNKEGKVAANLETFLGELKNVPGVVSVSSTTHIFQGHQTKTSGLEWERKNPEDQISFEFAKVNYDMIETLGITMKAGRTFSKAFSTDNATIILNEKAVEVMGLKEPVGKTIKLWGVDRQIIGVTKNFHFQSLHEEIQPFFFLLLPAETEKIMVKIEAGQEKPVLNRLEKLYQAYNNGFTLDYTFLDQGYQSLYVAEQRVSILSRYFAGVAILISCLGLFGLAAFTAERRRKEIGIRKVLGSTQFDIVYLLSSEFTKMVLVSILIAIPVSYLLTKGWLDNFAFSIELEWWYFIGAGCIALLIAWITVGVQAIKAAKVHPIKSIRSE